MVWEQLRSHGQDEIEYVGVVFMFKVGDYHSDEVVAFELEEVDMVM